MSELTIETLGARGDGIARENGETIFVPFALPGETVRADGARPHARLLEVMDASPDRAEPICPHFGTCGGCVAQHMDDRFYLRWKREVVVDAFRREGLDAAIEDTISIPPHTRRRAVLAAVRAGGEVRLGFHERGSEAVLDIESCPVLTPALEALLPDVKGIAATVLRGNEEIQITLLDSETGVDCALVTSEDPSEDMLAALVRAASRAKVARVAVNSATVFADAEPALTFGETPVGIPPGGFVQAAAEAQTAMVDIAVRHLHKAKRVADLFSGSGTFTYALARRTRVTAYEGDGAAVAALDGAHPAAGTKPVTAMQRDLYDAPLTALELNAFDGVCLDPPRAGAAEQCAALAGSTVTRIAYVSCNPITLARDAAALVRGGYTLERVVPVDQFVFSHHVEAVALFKRADVKAKTSIFKRR